VQPISQAHTLANNQNAAEITAVPGEAQEQPANLGSNNANDSNPYDKFELHINSLA
jgi:hypothetical protein